VFNHIRADFQRYYAARSAAEPPPLAAVRSLLEYGFLATAVYRFGRWTRTIRPKLLSYPFKLLYALASTLVDILFGINLSTNAEIGPGLYIGHYGGIFLHGHMGRNCSVGQGVTVGYKGAGKSTGVPHIGDNVYIGAGAFVLGDLRIGDGVVIGANTTVVTDVPAGARVVSAASRILPAPAPQPAASHPGAPAVEAVPAPLAAADDVDQRAAAAVDAAVASVTRT
jgi:serine O-acetyltransferase